jgi:hypothetical protein
MGLLERLFWRLTSTLGRLERTPLNVGFGNPLNVSEVKGL